MPAEDTLGDRVKRQIREIYSVASVRTEEYARIGKKRLDILSLNREVAREKRSLGDRVYDLSQRERTQSILEDVTVKAILGRIRKLEAQMRELEQEIARIRDEARKAREERAVRKAAAAPPSGEAAPEGSTEAGEEAQERAGSGPGGAQHPQDESAPETGPWPHGDPGPERPDDPGPRHGGS